MFQFTTRLLAETEARFTAVERITNYAKNLPEEKPVSMPTDPPASWPEQGVLTFDDVTVRYREGLPHVLRNVSFSIKPNEKIGIAGRTGIIQAFACMLVFYVNVVMDLFAFARAFFRL